MKDYTSSLVGTGQGKLNKVGEYFVDPGLSRQKCSVFITEDIISQGNQQLEETEQGMVVKKVSLNELDEMMHAGLLADSWGYVANHFIQEYLRQK
jgi:hypothetical protein